jgi:uncharacterized protein
VPDSSNSTVPTGSPAGRMSAPAPKVAGVLRRPTVRSASGASSPNAGMEPNEVMYQVIQRRPGAPAYRAGMWILEMAFTAAPERLAARAQHRRRLAALHADGVILMAGPFADDDGALIVVAATDRRAVDGIIAADPYFTTAGVAVTRVRQWHPFLGAPSR